MKVFAYFKRKTGEGKIKTDLVIKYRYGFFEKPGMDKRSTQLDTEAALLKFYQDITIYRMQKGVKVYTDKLPPGTKSIDGVVRRIPVDFVLSIPYPMKPRFKF